MPKRVLKHYIENLEIEYEHHPRIFWIIFFIVAFLFIIIQSYIALEGNVTLLLVNSFFPIIISLSTLFIFIKPENRNLLIIGTLYFILTILTYFSNIIQKPYGTFFFLYGVWLVVDWYNYKKNKKSIFSELIKGNYYLAFGVFLALFIFGLITEFVNIPFAIWYYNIPLPSINNFGIPAVIAAFGWIPWVLAILAIFYLFAFKKPKRYRKND